MRPLFYLFTLPSSGGKPLQLADQPDGLGTVAATHIHHGAKTAAHRRPLRLTEDLAAKGAIELDTGDASRFAIWHTGNGTADTGAMQQAAQPLRHSIDSTPLGRSEPP